MPMVSTLVKDTTDWHTRKRPRPLTMRDALGGWRGRRGTDSKQTPASLSAVRSALVSYGRPSKVPNVGALKNRNIPSQFRRPEVRGRGASGAELSAKALGEAHREQALAALSGKCCSHDTFLSRLLLGQLQAASPSPAGKRLTPSPCPSMM